MRRKVRSTRMRSLIYCQVRTKLVKFPSRLSSSCKILHIPQYPAHRPPSKRRSKNKKKRSKMKSLSGPIPFAFERTPYGINVCETTWSEKDCQPSRLCRFLARIHFTLAKHKLPNTRKLLQQTTCRRWRLCSIARLCGILHHVGGNTRHKWTGRRRCSRTKTCTAFWRTLHPCGKTLGTRMVVAWLYVHLEHSWMMFLTGFCRRLWVETWQTKELSVSCFPDVRVVTASSCGWMKPHRLQRLLS